MLREGTSACFTSGSICRKTDGYLIAEIDCFGAITSPRGKRMSYSEDLHAAALAYHRLPRPGKLEIQAIKPLAKATRRPGADASLGGFGALFDLKAAGYADPLLVTTTDGVGTKLRVAIESGWHDTVGIDLVAMCVNDVVVQGAEPLFFLDYYATGALDVAVAERVIAGIVEGCVQAGCALVGGETAEMPGMYHGKDYDLAGFSVGIVEKDRIIDGSKAAIGDVVLGLPSSGPHSNGFSLIRKILEVSGAWTAAIDWLRTHWLASYQSPL